MRGAVATPHQEGQLLTQIGRAGAKANRQAAAERAMVRVLHGRRNGEGVAGLGFQQVDWCNDEQARVGASQRETKRYRWRKTDQFPRGNTHRPREMEYDVS